MASATDAANGLTVVYIIVTVVLGIAVPVGGYFFRASTQSLKANTDATNRLGATVERLEEKVKQLDEDVKEDRLELRDHDRQISRLRAKTGLWSE